jgi:hypothetical protein
MERMGNYGACQSTSKNTRDRGRTNSPLVATQRTTEREPRRDLALSTTPPEMLTAAVAVDGLQSAARRSAAKGSDDMAAMGESWAYVRLFRRLRWRMVDTAGEGKTVIAGQDRNEERLLLVWEGKDVIFLIQ